MSYTSTDFSLDAIRWRSEQNYWGEFRNQAHYDIVHLLDMFDDLAKEHARMIMRVKLLFNAHAGVKMDSDEDELLKVKVLYTIIQSFDDPEKAQKMLAVEDDELIEMAEILNIEFTEKESDDHQGTDPG